MARVVSKNGKYYFVVCVDNTSNPESLEIGKVYRALPDPDAERDKWIRVIDEEREDYLYPEDYFVKVEFSPSARKRFIEAIKQDDAVAQK